ncbi:MAG: hypothetical protein BWY11_00189 [Firmicutes bacterium ADurb.Bin182]|nr:MAG: hypothetical protein BWY11_00189 [Firmicutes bacterium ADurb.Bin182]
MKVRRKNTDEENRIAFRTAEIINILLRFNYITKYSVLQQYYSTKYNVISKLILYS